MGGTLGSAQIEPQVARGNFHPFSTIARNLAHVAALMSYAASRRTIMNRLSALALSAGLSLLIGSAFADDDSATHEQLVRDCMAKQKEDKSTTRTNDQMMKVCQKQVKAGKVAKPKDKKAASEPTPN
jgi:hypothetical protein